MIINYSVRYCDELDNYKMKKATGKVCGSNYMVCTKVLIDYFGEDDVSSLTLTAPDDMLDFDLTIESDEVDE